MSDLPVNINLDVYHVRLVTTLDGHIGALRAALRSVEDGTYGSLANRPRSDALVRFQVDAGPEGVASAACHDCLVQMVRCFLDFLDAMIAVADIKQRGVTVDRDLVGDQAIIEYLQDQIADRIRKVAVDRSLSAPKKIERVGPLSEFSQKAANSYIALRNCVEHHKGIAEQPIELLYKQLIITVDNTTVIEKLPHILNKGQSLGVTTREISRIIKKGERADVSEQELEDIAFTLRVVVAPEIIGLMKKTM